MSVRVRFAPSPTGRPHIGNIRTALFNYFFARAQKGTFILRIEDTDRERFQADSLQDIYDTLSWLSIDWDEGPVKGGSCGPYFQSERKDIYHTYSKQMVENGTAYPCFCTSERLEQVRKEQEASKATSYGYDRKCRSLSKAEAEEKIGRGEKHVLRLKIPLEGKTTFTDNLLGPIERANTDISPDPVLIKTDGFPTYHFANVIDDHLMGITHIMRAQEWISSVPIHIHIYAAFGWEPPLFYHLPMVLGKDGQKLSKRHGATSLYEFRNKGYLPEAIVNYITLLGWGYDGKREFFTQKDLTTLFDLKNLNKSSSIFDYQKLDWFNGQYIREKTPEDLKNAVMPFLKEAGLFPKGPTAADEQLVTDVIPLIQPRLKVLTEAYELVKFLFAVPDYAPVKDDFIPKKMDKAAAIRILETIHGMLDGFFDRTDAENEQVFKDTATGMDMKLGDFLLPLRVAMTGSKVSLPLFESLRLFKKQKSKERIQNAISFLRNKE